MKNPWHVVWPDYSARLDAMADACRVWMRFGTGLELIPLEP